MAHTIVVRTDNKWKNFTDGWRVPKRVRTRDFDYLDDNGESDPYFFKYKNRWHNLSEYSSGSFGVPGWTAYLGLTYWSCYLIKVSRDGDQYKIAYAYQKDTE